MERLLKLITFCFLSLSTFGATGSWNGIAFTAWNGVVQTSWNGTGISCGGGGSPAWIDVITIPDATTDGVSDQAILLFQKITFSSGGTVSKLRVYSSQDLVGGNIKIALYDSGKNLLQSGTSSWPINVAGQYTEVTITPQVVTATDYYIGWDSDGAFQTWRYNTSGGTCLYKFSSYAAFPVNPIAEDGSLVRQYVVSAYLTP